MALFKDTVALEACPAKTAESVSYGATFAVLGWIVFSNYSGLGYASTENDTLAATELITSSSESSALLPASTFDAASNTPALSQAQPSSTMAAASEAAYTPLSDLAAWHDSLQPLQYSGANSVFREFSASAWSGESPQVPLLADQYRANLRLTMPALIGSEDFSQPSEESEWARSEGQSRQISEITVTGSEPSRLAARPDNIRRPQLPRPYRAQEIQRSLVLPPRIQALRP